MWPSRSSGGRSRSELDSSSATPYGRRRSVEPRPRETLLELLRREFGTLGVREACGIGMCGACTVEVNGRRPAAAVKFVAAKGLLKLKGDEAALGLRRGLNLVTVTTSGRASRAFALVL